MSKSTFKCLLYIAVATLTSLSTEMNNITNFNEISTIKWVVILFHAGVQGLIAWKAFLDQTITTDKETNQDL
jgi:hypothetical protein